MAGSRLLRTVLRRYGIAVAVTLAALALHWWLLPLVGSRAPFIGFWPAIAVAALAGGRLPGWLPLLSGLAWAGWVLPPGGSFLVAERGDQLVLALFVAIGMMLIEFSERMHRVAERAAAAEERLVMAIQGTGIGVFDVDLAGELAYCSPALARLVNLPVSSRPVPLQQWLQRSPPGLLAESRERLREQFRARSRAYEREVCLPQAEGPPMWLLLRVHIGWRGERAVRLRGACVDITERKAIESQLAQAQTRLRQQVDDLDQLHAVSTRLLDAPDLREQLGLILRAVARFHGTERGLVSLLDPSSGRLVTEASLGFGPDALAELAGAGPGDGACAATVAQRRRVVIADVEADDRCRAWRAWARRHGVRAAHGTPLLSAAGEVLGAITVHFDAPREPTERECTLADICAHKAAVYSERWRGQAALRDADRRKDEFLATLAHELRNPLAPIRQAALLATSAASSEEQKRWSHEVIDRQVRHMALLLDDLLDVSRITRGALPLRKEATELRAVVSGAVETARPAIDAMGHRLDISLPPADVHFRADPLRIAQVVANLLTNAAKYTERGGHISLRARRAGDEIEIIVSDDGIGIPAESLPEVFRMFSQLHASRERGGAGLGIGLALSKGLVELHGGQLGVHSSGAGTGSTFTVRLPVGSDAAEVPGSANPVPGSLARLPRRILIADDNRDAADSLAALLQLDGHETRLSFDGDDALAAYDRFQPDVCLLDIGMPGRNGYEVARRIRQLSQVRRPVLIAITGWGQESDRQQAVDAGFDHHLTKPVDPLRLAGLFE